jgi:histidyl-tRNA synthetase
MEKITAVRGVKDILPTEAPAWRRLEEIFRGVFAAYGYGEIRLPIFEATSLFVRGIGTETDIVGKEMYTFEDKGGGSITLRPEGTASTVRAFLEHNMGAQGAAVKVWYAGPMFRHERPQKGRLRQFHQVGAEIFNVAGPEAEAELLEMLAHVLRHRLGLDRLSLEVNTLGDAACRPAYREALVAYLSGRREELCENCRRRLDTNPLRVLDCKAAGCRKVAEDAPSIHGFLCEPCRDHFARFLDLLKGYGVEAAVNHRMVRGLDYYARTTFEILSGDLGAQNAVAAGGRYDGLVEQFGGPPTPGLGFALGVERLLTLLEGKPAPPPPPSVYLAAIDDPGRVAVRGIAAQLRHAGVTTQADLQGRSLKSQLRSASSLGAAAAVILGGDELVSGMAVVRDMKAASQETVALGDLAVALGRLLAR